MPTGSSSSYEALASDEGYLFVDNARFLSILFIVARHTEPFEASRAPLTALEGWIIQFRTFGVLTFLVISAFLMAPKVAAPDFRGRVYWWNRIVRLAAPWAVWLLLDLAIDLFKMRVMHPDRASRPGYLFSILTEHVLYKAYWYVPVLLFSLGLLLPLRRFWNKPWFGLLLCGITVLHGINQYFGWFPAGHTVAVFGYVFFLWLGVQVFRHFAALEALVRRVPWGIALAAFALALVGARAEGHVLDASGESFNPLNLSTQLYSLICLGILIKLPFRLAPRFIDVRKVSFGIYLTHQVVGSVVRGSIDWVAGLPADGRSETLFRRIPDMVQQPIARIAVWFLWLAIVYLTALLTTHILLKTPLAWLVGGTRKSNSTVSPLDGAEREVRAPEVRHHLSP